MTQKQPGMELAKIERPIGVDGIQDLAAIIHAAARRLDAFRCDPLLAWTASNAGLKAYGALRHVAEVLDNMQYHSMCPSCGGQKCAFCMRTGWVPYWRYQEWENAHE